MKRQHARRGRAAERRHHPEALPRAGEEARVALGEPDAHFAELPRARLGRDAVENGAGDLALGSAPRRLAGGDEVRLRAQDHAVLDDLQSVGGERRARGSDVDDELGGAGARRRLGGAEALHDAIVGNPVAGEEVPRQIHIFGRDPHLAVMTQAECGGDVVEVGHQAYVDPGLRHGDDHVGVSEPELLEEHDACLGVRDHLPHQIFAGDAELRGALRQLDGDLRRGQIGDFHAGDAVERAAIFARAARLHQHQPGAAEERLRVLLQAALRGHREHERRRHGWPPIACRRSIQTANPTAGIGFSAPSRDSSAS